MKQVKKKSPVPPYAVAGLWLLRALSGKLHSFWQVVWCVILSLGLFYGLKLFFPDKLVEEEAEEPKKAPEKPEKQEPAPAKPAPEPVKSTGDPEADAVLKEGRAAVAEIQRLNDDIPDFKVSAQLKQMEILTGKILDWVEKNPGNARQIRQLMDYYLPTTIKLLNQYVTLQNQELRIGNINEGMQKIEDMLEKINVALQKQLDSLFESDVVDITADIQVMEQMMASQGLTNEKDFA